MRLYLATEAKNLAKAFNSKKHKQTLEPYMEDIMFLIGEAAKSGKFSVGVEFPPEDLYEVVVSSLQDMGYTVVNYDPTLDPRANVKERTTLGIKWGI